MSLKDLHILIVDDEESLSQIIAKALNAHGAQTLEAKNGKDAFELVKKNKFDFVVSDIRMPGGDGLTLLAEIQALPEPKPKVVMITGHSDVSSQEVLKSGAAALLPKPFGRAKLIDCIEKLV